MNAVDSLCQFVRNEELADIEMQISRKNKSVFDQTLQRMNAYK